jgi:hypothetical protein
MRSYTYWISSVCHWICKDLQATLSKLAPWHGAPRGTVATNRPFTVLLKSFQTDDDGHAVSPGKVLHLLLARAAPKSVEAKTVERIVRLAETKVLPYRTGSTRLPSLYNKPRRGWASVWRRSCRELVCMWDLRVLVSGGGGWARADPTNGMIIFDYDGLTLSLSSWYEHICLREITSEAPEFMVNETVNFQADIDFFCCTNQVEQNTSGRYHSLLQQNVMGTIGS